MKADIIRTIGVPIVVIGELSTVTGTPVSVIGAPFTIIGSPSTMMYVHSNTKWQLSTVIGGHFRTKP